MDWLSTDIRVLGSLREVLLEAMGRSIESAWSEGVIKTGGCLPWVSRTGPVGKGESGPLRAQKLRRGLIQTKSTNVSWVACVVGFVVCQIPHVEYSKHIQARRQSGERARNSGQASLLAKEVVVCWALFKPCTKWLKVEG